jgi:hypothetical protein
MNRQRRDLLRVAPLALASGGLVSPRGTQAAGSRSVTVWHGDEQRVGHLGDAQDDFNLMGRVEPWLEVDRLSYRINNRASTPLSFRAYRRLVEDGDFNADVPIGQLQMGANTITVDALFRDGKSVSKKVLVHREQGSRKLPHRIDWSTLKHFQDAGQAVDGHWELTPAGLRTRQIGYDRVFLIGTRDWVDYEVRTTVTIHAVPNETTPISGGNGLGIILRFAGHVSGGPRHFPSGQPKWGYQPFGAIGWLRWTSRNQAAEPHAQFYPGDSDRWVNKIPFPVETGVEYGMCFSCETMPDAPDGSGVTLYRYKVWRRDTAEPEAWTWEHTQRSQFALRRGGFTLLAHHIDATFGVVEIVSLSGKR